MSSGVDLGAPGTLFTRLTAMGLPDDMERASAMLSAAGATDGLPVVPPTEDRVRTFLGAVPHRTTPPGSVPLAMRPATLLEIGAACVMAGCPPAAWPVVTAAIDALTSPDFNLLGVQTTTSRVAPLLIVSGPMVAGCGLSSAENGPTARGNLAVGRSVRLLLHLLGNWLPGVDNPSTVGNLAKIGWCVAESARSPWPPFHHERLPEAGSAVTAVATAGSLEVVLGQGSTDVDLDILSRASDAVREGGLTGERCRDQAVVVVSPETAQRLADAGVDRRSVADQILGRSAVPTAADRPEILVVVSGGIGIKGAVVQTWGSGRAVTAAVRAGDAEDGTLGDGAAGDGSTGRSLGR